VDIAKCGVDVYFAKGGTESGRQACLGRNCFLLIMSLPLGTLDDDSKYTLMHKTEKKMY
jgi:hypothetical protein